MLVPVHDQNPIKYIRIPYVTLGLILLNIGIFLVFQNGLAVFGLTPDMGAVKQSAVIFGLIPAELLGPTASGAIEWQGTLYQIPESWTVISYMFLHGSWLHLIGNILFLWVFGDNIEDAMGHFKFLIFYILSGVSAGLFQAYLIPGLQIPVIGASGAVAGLIGAYLMLHPRVNMWALALNVFPVQLKAIWIIGIWLAVQLINIFSSANSHVAWGTHVGGFLAGIFLIILLKRKEVKLFQ